MDYQKQNASEFLKQLNLVIKEYTILLRNGLDLYKDYSSENMINSNDHIQNKKENMKHIMIKLTLSATELISIADNEDLLK